MACEVFPLGRLRCEFRQQSRNYSQLLGYARAKSSMLDFRQALSPMLLG